jgi:hypothetical protein
MDTSGRSSDGVIYLVRVLLFVLTGAVTWFFLFLFLGFAVLAVGGIEAVKDCQYVECRSPGEFIYDSSWPLVPLLLILPSAAVGLLINRRIG